MVWAFSLGLVDLDRLGVAKPHVPLAALRLDVVSISVRLDGLIPEPLDNHFAILEFYPDPITILALAHGVRGATATKWVENHIPGFGGDTNNAREKCG